MDQFAIRRSSSFRDAPEGAGLRCAIAQGRPDVPANLWRRRSCAFLNFAREAMGANGAPGFPCALCFGGNDSLAPRRQLPRGKADACVIASVSEAIQSSLALDCFACAPRNNGRAV
jgi:hypothetical protein